MKKRLLLILLLPLLAGCSLLKEKEDDPQPSSGSLDGRWQLQRHSGFVIDKSGKRTNVSETGPATIISISLGPNGKTVGLLGVMLLDQGIAADNLYVYKVTGDELFFSIPTIEPIDYQRLYFKLAQSGNTMTWTLTDALVRRAIKESDNFMPDALDLALGGDEKDFEKISTLELKYEFKKL